MMSIVINITWQASMKYEYKICHKNSKINDRGTQILFINTSISMLNLSNPANHCYKYVKQ